MPLQVRSGIKIYAPEASRAKLWSLSLVALKTVISTSFPSSAFLICSDSLSVKTG